MKIINKLARKYQCRENFRESLSRRYFAAAKLPPLHFRSQTHNYEEPRAFEQHRNETGHKFYRTDGRFREVAPRCLVRGGGSGFPAETFRRAETRCIIKQRRREPFAFAARSRGNWHCYGSQRTRDNRANVETLPCVDCKLCSMDVFVDHKYVLLLALRLAIVTIIPKYIWLHLIYFTRSFILWILYGIFIKKSEFKN